MPANTPIYNFPYPLGTDPVAQGDNDIRALAEDVETVVSGIDDKLGSGVSPASGASDGSVIVADGTGASAWSANAVGLWLIKTQTIGTGVSSVTVNDAFNANYENYLITVTGGVASTGMNIQMRLGSSNTGVYSGSLIYMSYAAGTLSVAADNNTTQFNFVGSGDSNNLALHATLLGPNLAKYTTIGSPYMGNSSGGNYSGVHKVATAYTAFTLLASSGTMTGGTIRVYGYRK